MEEKCFKNIVERCRYMAQVAKSEVMRNSFTAAADEIERLMNVNHIEHNLVMVTERLACADRADAELEDNGANIRDAVRDAIMMTHNV